MPAWSYVLVRMSRRPLFPLSWGYQWLCTARCVCWELNSDPHSCWIIFPVSPNLMQNGSGDRKDAGWKWGGGKEEPTGEVFATEQTRPFWGLSEQSWMLKSQLWNATGKPQQRCPKLTLWSSIQLGPTGTWWHANEAGSCLWIQSFRILKDETQKSQMRVPWIYKTLGHTG